MNNEPNTYPHDMLLTPCSNQDGGFLDRSEKDQNSESEVWHNSIRNVVWFMLFNAAFNNISVISWQSVQVTFHPEHSSLDTFHQECGQVWLYSIRNMVKFSYISSSVKNDMANNAIH